MNNAVSALRRSTISMLAFLGATAGWAVLPPATAGAVTFTVNRNDDPTPGVTGVTCINAGSVDCSLREAVIKLNATAACAPPNAPCIINFAASTSGSPIVLTITSTSNAADASTGDLDINANVVIQGNGPVNTVIQGAFPVEDNKDNKIFGINQDGTHDNLQVTIDNVTVTGGRNSVLFNDPSFAWTGGGIDIFLTGTTAKTVLSNCIITDNTNVHGYGGGINISSLGPGGVENGILHGSVEITNCEISNNHELGTPNPSTTDQFGTCGGGICTGFSDNHNVTITDSRIGGNTTPGSGGGIGIIMNHGTVAIHHSTIGGAQSPNAGCSDCGNTAGQQGGGINADGLGAQAVIVDAGSIIRNNVAGNGTAAGAVGSGGGIQSGNSANSSTSLSKVTIIGNSVSPNAPTQRGGGGILAGGNLTVSFSRIVGNSGGAGGGNGLRVDNGGPGTVTATNNWWGCNDGPSAAPCDTALLGSGAGGATLAFNPWLVLSLGANPTSVLPNGTSALTADFLHKSDATSVVPADIAVLLGLPIAFGSTHGTISGAQATIQPTGTATATFTHDGTCLAGTASATVDTTPGPTVSSSPIAVTCTDLTATKTNNVGGSVPLSSASWTWTIHVANGGSAPANFSNTQTILSDTLPGGANITYGVAGVSNVNGITGTISCGIAGNVLTCTASGDVTIAAPGSFDVSFTANASVAGTYVNPAGTCAVDPSNNVTETNEGNNSCSDSVTVVGPPTITKAFSPTTIGVGGTSRLSFTITNPNTGVGLTGVAFTDTLPAGVQVSSSPNASNTCNGTLSATAGSGAISLNGGTIAAGLSCAISVDVTATTAGAKDNTTGAVSSTNGGTGGTSNTATLATAGPPTISKAFSPASITVGGISTLSFTLANPNTGVALAGVAFSDTLPAGVQVAAAPNVSNTCSGTVSATAGSGVISLSGGSITANGSCSISVDVTATTAGTKSNTTGAVSSTNGGTGATSNTATLSVANLSPPTISKAFSPTTIDVGGTSSLSFTLANPNTGIGLTGVAFSDTLPAGVQVSPSPNASNTCAGTLSATAGSGVISLSGGSIAAGGSCNISVDVTATTSGTKSNTTGAVSSTNGGTGATSNTATLTVNAPAADLAVVNSATPSGSVNAGANVTYTITVSNNGPNTANSVSLDDAVPAGTGFVSLVVPAGWSCTTPAVGSSGTINCTKASLANAESSTFIVVAQVSCTVPNNTSVSNTASASAASPADNNTGNNSQTVAETVSNPAPVINATVGVSSLWPPNHNLVNVRLAVVAGDGSCPAPTSFTVQVFSDKDDQTPTDPKGPSFSPDAKGIGVGTLRLRAERAGSGDGRVYLIVVRATDAVNQTGFGTTTVVVPKSTSTSHRTSVGAAAVAAKAFADANNGNPPAGFFIVGDGPIVGPKQ